MPCPSSFPSSTPDGSPSPSPPGATGILPDGAYEVVVVRAVTVAGPMCTPMPCRPAAALVHVAEPASWWLRQVRIAFLPASSRPDPDISWPDIAFPLIGSGPGGNV
ncbi:hypothetical protein [Actinoplanes sp. CA-252034]|uniref:hypothetical protein n=1 Tax=Actinoplanes sp. CA-252034 TaxID=3239906 RepID=UPI003D98ADB6